MSLLFETKTSDVSKLAASEFNQGIATPLNNIVKTLTEAGININTFEAQEALNHLLCTRQSGFEVGGTANAITISTKTSLISAGFKVLRHFHGQVFCFLATYSNTGATTIKVDDLAVKNLKMSNNTDIGANYIKAGDFVYVRYDSVNDIYVLMNRNIASIPSLYLDTEVNIDDNNGYRILRKADNTIARMEQWGLYGGISDDSGITVNYHTPFSKVDSVFGLGYWHGGQIWAAKISTAQFTLGTFSEYTSYTGYAKWYAFGK